MLDVRWRQAQAQAEVAGVTLTTVKSLLSTVQSSTNKGNKIVGEERFLYSFLESLKEEYQTQHADKDKKFTVLASQVETFEVAFQQKVSQEAKKLALMSDVLRKTIVDFKAASDKATRIGDKLSRLEKERKRIVRCIKLFKTIHTFEHIDSNAFHDLLKQSNTLAELQPQLPNALRTRPLLSLCEFLHDLRKVVGDVNATEVQNAQNNILALCQLVESELLDTFEMMLVSFKELKSAGKKDDASLAKLQELALALQYFASGSSLEKRFLFSIVEQMMALGNSNFTTSTSSKKEILSNTDHLSRLFGSLSQICSFQFDIISNVFPRISAIRVMRLFIQRIFNDPAFGIQAQIEDTLYPPLPQPALSISEFLNTLCIVREKLAAFHLMLEDLCRQFGMMGNNNNNNNNNTNRNSLHLAVDPNQDLDLLGGSNTNNGSGGNSNSSLEEISKNFLSDQVHQVFNSFIGDYFQKELTHLKFQYSRLLTQTISEAQLSAKQFVTTTTVRSPLPQFKAEKMKTIVNIARTVGNNEFIDQVFAISVESVTRMSSVARDDRKIGSRVKEVYLLHCQFLLESVLVPTTQAMTSILLRQSAATLQASRLPPPEFLPVLSAILAAVDKFKSHFSDYFAPHLFEFSNQALVCQELSKPAMHLLMTCCREALFAWGFCVTVHIDKMLLNLQSKHDFNPQFDNLPTISAGQVKQADCTSTSQHVCKTILMVAMSVRYFQESFSRIDLKQVFWRPFAQQFVGILISHIRRNKISIHGSRRLIKDLEEYFQLFTVFDVPVALDMIRGLREIAIVFTVPSDLVARVVVDSLRHLDSNIVMALVKSRADHGTSAANGWSRELFVQFGSLNNNNQVFPWESKRQLTILSFKAAIAPTADPQLLGPLTLRKSSTPLSPALLQELAHMTIPSTNMYAQTQLFQLNKMIQYSHSQSSSSLLSNSLTTAAVNTLSQGLKSSQQAASQLFVNAPQKLLEEAAQWRKEGGSALLFFHHDNNNKEGDGEEDGDEDDSHDGNGRGQFVPKMRDDSEDDNAEEEEEQKQKTRAAKAKTTKNATTTASGTTTTTTTTTPKKSDPNKSVNNGNNNNNRSKSVEKHNLIQEKSKQLFESVSHLFGKR